MDNFLPKTGKFRQKKRIINKFWSWKPWKPEILTKLLKRSGNGKRLLSFEFKNQNLGNFPSKTGKFRQKKNQILTNLDLENLKKPKFWQKELLKRSGNGNRLSETIFELKNHNFDNFPAKTGKFRQKKNK